MKARNIKSVCRNKILDLCEHIDNEDVAKAVRDNAIITGGAIASMLLGEEVKDFDVYFRTRAATLLIAKYFVDRFKTAKQLKHKGGASIDIWVDDTLPDRISIHVKSAGAASVASENNYQYFEQTDPESGDAAEYAETALSATK